MVTGVKTASQFRKLQDRYGTDHAIAVQLCVSRQAIHQLRHRLGIGTTNCKQERNSRIKKDWTKGYSSNRLAKKYKISITMIYRILNK
jgi:Mor family transcriptional regulator